MLRGGRGFSCNKHEQIKLKVMTASLKNCKPSSVFTAQQYTKVSKQSSTANWKKSVHLLIAEIERGHIVFLHALSYL